MVGPPGLDPADTFHEEDPDRLTDELDVDVANLVDITRAFTAPLREAGTGVLVDVASVAAHTPVPGMAVSSAAKAFVLDFTEAATAVATRHRTRSSRQRCAPSTGATADRASPQDA